MSKKPIRAHAHPSRKLLLKALDEAARRMGAQAVLVSDLVATRVGLNATDLECLDLLYLAGATTAGRLSAYTGLTTGATTAVIDRLEGAGFVKRSRDPNDRRVVLVEVLEHSGPQIEPFYHPLGALLAKVNRRYDDRQLATVVEYLSEALEAGAQHVAWLQTQPAISHKRCRHLGGPAAPLVPGGRSALQASSRVSARPRTTPPRRAARRQEHASGTPRRK